MSPPGAGVSDSDRSVRIAGELARRRAVAASGQESLGDLTDREPTLNRPAAGAAGRQLVSAKRRRGAAYLRGAFATAYGAVKRRSG